MDLPHRLENWIFRDPPDRGKDAEEAAQEIRELRSRAQQLRDALLVAYALLDDGNVDEERREAAMERCVLALRRENASP